MFPQIFVEIINVVNRSKESLQLGFINNDIRKFISKMDGFTNWTNFSFRDIIAKESKFCLKQFDFLGRDNSKTISFDGFQKRIQMFLVFINRVGINKNIINKNNGEMAKGIEDIIHNVLEFTRGILKTKRHNIPLIISKMSGEKIGRAHV